MVNFITPGYGPPHRHRQARPEKPPPLCPLPGTPEPGGVFPVSPDRPGPGVSPEGRTGEVFSVPAPGPAAAGGRRGARRSGGSAGRPPGGHQEIFAALEEALGLLDQGCPPIPCCPPSCCTSWAWGATGPACASAGSAARSPPRPLASAFPGAACSAAPAGGEAPGPLLPLSPGTWKLLRLAQDLPREKLSRLRFPPHSGTRAWRSSRPSSATTWART